MSEEQPPEAHSSPTSAGVLILRGLFAVAILAIIGTIIWYTTK